MPKIIFVDKNLESTLFVPIVSWYPFPTYLKTNSVV